MIFLQLYGKALLLGFTNGLFLGRSLRNKRKIKKEKIYKVQEKI